MSAQSPAAAEGAPPSTAAADRPALLPQSTGEGIFGIDMEGRCTFVNRAVAQMLGWSTDMVLGRRVAERGDLLAKCRQDPNHGGLWSAACGPSSSGITSRARILGKTSVRNGVELALYAVRQEGSL